MHVIEDCRNQSHTKLHQACTYMYTLVPYDYTGGPAEDACFL